MSGTWSWLNIRIIITPGREFFAFKSVVFLSDRLISRRIITRPHILVFHFHPERSADVIIYPLKWMRGWRKFMFSWKCRKYRSFDWFFNCLSDIKRHNYISALMFRHTALTLYLSLINKYKYAGKCWNVNSITDVACLQYDISVIAYDSLNKLNFTC